MSKIILAVDIGSTKICSIIAEVRTDTSDKNKIRIIGTGYKKSQGIKKGVVVDMDAASRSIRASVEDAKRIAGVDVSKAIISLSGVNTQSCNAKGMATIHGEVTIETINIALNNAIHNARILGDSEIIHVLPFRFQLDDQDYVDDPIGMTGELLRVETHIVFAKSSSLSNLRKVASLSNLEIQNIVLSAYAASIAVLEPDERELGIVCIDMGGDTCDIMIYDGNSMRYSNSIRLGSNNVSKDIASSFNTTLEMAEQIKLEYGALLSEEQNDKYIKIPIIGNPEETNNVDLYSVCGAMQYRVAEILAILGKTLQTSPMQDRLSGVVLTGGMVNMEGMRELAGTILSPLSIRIAQPVELVGSFDNLKKPSSSVTVGLVLYGAGNFTNYEKDSSSTTRSRHLQDFQEIESQEINSFKIPNQVDNLNLENLNRQIQPTNNKKEGLISKIKRGLTSIF